MTAKRQVISTPGCEALTSSCPHSTSDSASLTICRINRQDHGSHCSYPHTTKVHAQAQRGEDTAPQACQAERSPTATST